MSLFVKPIGEPNPPMVILISLGISTEYDWRYRGTIGEMEWDCPGETTRESLLASVIIHARSVTTDRRRITTARTRPDDDGDDRSGNCRSHNIVITSTSCIT